MSGPDPQTARSAAAPDPSDDEFAGKVVVVTGGGSGLGFGIARAFARRGASVVVAGRSRETAETAVAAIARETAAPALAVIADVGVPAQCEALVAEAVARFGAVDTLVNNAAYFALVPLLDMEPETARRFVDTNLLGPLHCGRALARWAIEAGRSATIVNVSSISAARPAPGCGLYSASKAGLDSLTRAMALEWTGAGVRVNGVAPGHVATEGVLADFASGRLDRAAILGRIPAGRIAEAEDIADVVLFLASEKSRHIVGQTVTVDGGEAM